MLSLVSSFCRHGCDATAIENGSKNKYLDLYVLPVIMTKTGVTCSRERKLECFSKLRPMALPHKESFG